MESIKSEDDRGVYWKNEKGGYHRVGGPAVINFDSKETMWCINGLLHRIDGPAYISPNVTEWWVNGTLHRIDGPAFESTLGTGNVWYIHGTDVTHKIKEWAEEMNIDLDNLTDDDRIILTMKWGDYND